MVQKYHFSLKTAQKSIQIGENHIWMDFHYELWNEYEIDPKLPFLGTQNGKKHNFSLKMAQKSSKLVETIISMRWPRFEGRRLLFSHFFDLLFFKELHAESNVIFSNHGLVRKILINIFKINIFKEIII